MRLHLFLLKIGLISGHTGSPLSHTSAAASFGLLCVSLLYFILKVKNPLRYSKKALCVKDGWRKQSNIPGRVDWESKCKQEAKVFTASSAAPTRPPWQRLRRPELIHRHRRRCGLLIHPYLTKSVVNMRGRKGSRRDRKKSAEVMDRWE